MSTLVLFCDASFRIDGSAGCGFIGVAGKTIVLGCLPLFDCATSTEAEALAAESALTTSLGEVPSVSRVVFHLDNQSVVSAINGEQNASGIGATVRAVQRFSRAHKVSVRAKWVKGHSFGKPSSQANGVAHKLADIGRKGETLSWSLRYDRQWRRRLYDLDERLGLGSFPQWMPIDAAARALSLPASTVFDLIQHGHLDSIGYEVSGESIGKVARVLFTMRRENHA